MPKRIYLFVGALLCAFVAACRSFSPSRVGYGQIRCVRRGWFTDRWAGIDEGRVSGNLMWK